VLEPTPDLSPQAPDTTVAVDLAPRRSPVLRAAPHRRVRARPVGLLAPAAPLGLVLLSALLVLLSAARPSFITPTASAAYFPSWMAGPLGGVWPLGMGEQAMHWLVAGILTAMYVAYLTSVTLAGGIRPRWVIGAILATHFLFLLAPPLQYTDVFNYINYGRMEIVHHLNPYATVPFLEPHTDPAFAISNWHWLISPYGPLFTLFTYALVPIGVAASFWTLKLLLCLASLAVLTLVWRCARLLGRDPVRAVAIVGLNPIVLVWGLGADHNDILMVLPLTLGVYLLIRARAGVSSLRLPHTGQPVPHELLAATALVAAAGVKASAAVVIPIAFAVAPRRRAFAAGLVLAGLALGLVSLLAFGPHLPGLGSQTNLVTDIGPPNVLGWIIGQGGESDTLRGILTVLAGGSVLYAALRGRRQDKDWIALAGASLFVVWITTSWFAPWYIVWMLPFAALAAGRRLLLCLTVFGVYLLITFGPEITPLLHTLHLNPFSSRLGEEHIRVITHLVQ
jgi:hypothetical protein